jgi:Zn-dependent protease
VNADLFAKVIVIAIILLVSFPVHEASHAFAAYRLGDGTAKLFGRLTLNPIAHFDPIGGLLLIISFLAANFGFGWAKPTPVNPRMLRGGRSSEAIVAAAGPLSNLVLAAIAGIVIRVLGLSGLDALPPVVSLVLVYFVLINLALMVFNFIPIPPLDGSKVLFAALDPSTEYRVRPTLEQYGFLILLVFIIPLGQGGSILGQILQGIINPLFRVLTGLTI